MGRAWAGCGIRLFELTVAILVVGVGEKLISFIEGRITLILLISHHPGTFVHLPSFLLIFLQVRSIKTDDGSAVLIDFSR